MIIHSTHKQRPDWTFNTAIPGGEHKFLYFVGVSTYQKSEQEARESARRNARENVSKYIGTEISSVITQSKNLDKKKTKSVQRQVTESMISQFEPKNWYVKKVRRPKNGATKIAWKAFVRLAIPREVVEKAIKRKHEKLKAKNQLVPEKDIRRVLFTSTSQQEKFLNQKVKESLTQSDLALTIADQSMANQPHFRIKTELSFTDQGKVRDIMHSHKAQYSISVSVKNSDQQLTNLKSFTGTHAAIGTTDSAAKQRAVKEIVQKHQKQIMETLKNPNS